ncbi:hypothetical protein IGI04_018245 [Brassica rapa subsp. trilocularis]|uniref:Uncharacterized protein n=1 Tax=Brassica rapa subsp. trilocularis TaxID=1813537 RepID=A0ABQ7MER9_BRACM|nr:hypothetical protein IGI04_018245 [Brassica rapa subsp. trilocularis]
MVDAAILLSLCGSSALGFAASLVGSLLEGLPFERRHRRVKALSRAVGGAVASRFEGAYLSVARGNWLSISDLLVSLGLSASRCLASY